MSTFPIETKHPDGVRTLPKGTQVHIRNGRAMEIWAPYKPDPDGWGATVQSESEREAEEFLGVELAPGFWRVDPPWYVLIFPRAMDTEDEAA